MSNDVRCSGGEFYEIESEYSAGSDRGGEDGDAMGHPKRQADLAPGDGGNIKLRKPAKRTYHGEKITQLGAEQKVGAHADREAIREQRTRQQLVRDREAETKRLFQDDERRRKGHGDGEGEEDGDDGAAGDGRAGPLDDQSKVISPKESRVVRLSAFI